MLVESLYADPVVAEIHEARRRLMEASGGDIAEFRRRLRERLNASGREIVSGPVKKNTEPRDAKGSRASS
ncbi:MAG: hypothetical protein WCJ31_00865 [Planctomycetia bacterium]